MREMSNPRTLDRHFPPAGDIGVSRWARWCGTLIALILGTLFLSAMASGQTLTLRTYATGITISPAGPNAYTGSFGVMNGLGVGTPSTGVTAIPLTGGTLYYTLINMTAGGLPGRRTANVTATLTSVGHPTAFTAETCPAPAGCTASTNYTALSTSTPITVATGLVRNQTVTSGVAVYVPDNDGGSYFTGTDMIVITYTIINTSSGRRRNITLTLNVQSETAVGLTLGTAPGGASIATALDFSLDFGNVNGMGIGPGSGFSVSALAGGVIYSTPYLLNAAFSEFASTTATIKVYVSTDFVHPAELNLRDASTSAGPYSSISKTSATPTLITASAADRSSITNYLGLFVSNSNGAGSFTGTDSATLTFSLTVP